MIMKKLLLIISLILVISSFTACSKTDVEEDISSSIDNRELLTDDEADALNKEDQEFQENYLRELDDATTEQRQNEQIALIDEIENSKIDKQTGKWAIWSCNAIEDSSTCLEYYGSFWTKESAKLNCADSWTFSTDPCPTWSVWGCNTWVWTAADMVAWIYLGWWWEVTADSVKYAQMACDATMASNWITWR